MKKRQLLFYLIFISLSAIGQNELYDNLPKHKLFFDFANIVKPFQSVGFGFEYTLPDTNALEVEVGYTYNSWFTSDIKGAYIKSAYKWYNTKKDDCRSYYATQLLYHYSNITAVGAFNIEEQFVYIEDYNRNKHKLGGYFLYGQEINIGNGFSLDINGGLGWQHSLIDINSEAVDRFPSAELTHSGIRGIYNNESFSNFDIIISARIKKDL